MPGFRLLSSESPDDRVAFCFDGRILHGRTGDSIASALLANGVSIVSRSFKLHRPRGVMSAGAHDANAIVRVRWKGLEEMSARATLTPLLQDMEVASLNGWPSVRFDTGRVADLLRSLLPPGFYYKTFMWPRWDWYEWLIRHSAGFGRPPKAADAARYEHREVEFDVVVVGAGPCGLTAAIAAAKAGARVCVLEQDWECGGSVLSVGSPINDTPGRQWAAEQVLTLGTLGATVLCSTFASGLYDGGLITALQTPFRFDSDGVFRWWRLHADLVILATGVTEQPLLFPDNDRPGIMLASSAITYARRFGVSVGKRVVLATTSLESLSAARALRAAGVNVAAVIIGTPTLSHGHGADAELNELRLITGARITATHGANALSAVTLEDTRGRRTRLPCDVLLMAGSVQPNLSVAGQLFGRLRYDSTAGHVAPETLPDNLLLVGDAHRCEAIDSSIERTAQRVIERLSTGNLHSPIPPMFEVQGNGNICTPARQMCNGAPGAVSSLARAFVDFRHDVTVNDLQIAVREGFHESEHLKRYTTVGMSIDQGKTSAFNAMTVLASLTGRAPQDIAYTTQRPPWLPVRLGAIAGPRVGPHYAPHRLLPTHAIQQQLGAQFEDFAGWQRPNFYPRGNEDEAAAVCREVRAVRTATTLCDTSPLGKIEVIGPHAAVFLDRMYANTMSTLPIGRVRYGLLLNERGVIINDGVCARISEQHYMLSTTSGAYERMLSWFEEWAHSAWPDLEIIVTGVAYSWGAVTLAGPRARELLVQLDTSIDFNGDAFPHMAMREGTLAGLPARVLRVSYSGEASFEINVPARHTSDLWESLWEVGQRYGLEPLGAEALMTLRTEKGYLHIGNETDASTVPDDVGWGPPVAKKRSEFIGKRSLQLPDNVRPDRLQLVGLVAEHVATAIHAGDHFVRHSGPDPKRRSHGWVTSAHWSPTCGRYVALAKLESGRTLLGQNISMFGLDNEYRAQVVSPCHFDPEGVRLHA